MFSTGRMRSTRSTKSKIQGKILAPPCVVSEMVVNICIYRGISTNWFNRSVNRWHLFSKEDLTKILYWNDLITQQWVYNCCHDVELPRPWRPIVIGYQTLPPQPIGSGTSFEFTSVVSPRGQLVISSVTAGIIHDGRHPSSSFSS